MLGTDIKKDTELRNTYYNALDEASEPDKLKAKAGSGQFLPRKAGKAAEPLGRATQEFDPKRNFGATLR